MSEFVVSLAPGSGSVTRSIGDSVFDRVEGVVGNATSAASSIASLLLNTPFTEFTTQIPEFSVSPVTSSLGDMAVPEQPGIGAAPEFNGGAAPDFTLPAISFASAPVFSDAPLAFSFLDKPVVSTPNSPGAAPAMSPVDLPDVPDIELPSVPSLRDIAIPDVPTVLMPVFDSQSPAGSLPELVTPNLFWDEADYTERLPELATKVRTMLGFDFEAAETAIWERGSERTDRATNEAVLQITNDMASRGFSLPTGVLVAAINEARMKGAEAKTDTAREAMIKAAEINNQKLTLAIQSGLQYEAMWSNLHAQRLTRLFEAAKITAELAVQINNAKVALFNAKLQAYQTDAQVHKDLIQAELAKLESYKVQLEGQKLIGEINSQDVELYKARLQGSMTAIELYKGQVQAVMAVVEVDKSRLQGFGAEVEAYKALISAGSAEYAAWAEAMKGESVKAQIYESQVRAYASRVEAFKSTESLKLEQGKLEIGAAELDLKVYQNAVAVFDSEIKAYASNADAVAKIYQGTVSGFDSTVKHRVASVEEVVKLTELQYERYKTEALTAIERAKLELLALQENVKQETARLQAAGSIQSQLGASAMSAFNMSESSSESRSYSRSDSISNSLSESYSASI